jgi:hypothetical protein
MSGNSSPNRGPDPAKKPKSAKGGAPADPCDLKFTTDLSAVNLPLLRTLTTGAVLNVDRISVHNLEAAVCKNSGGEVIGTITAIEGLAALLDCLRNGVVYSAKIIHIRGAACTVHVQRIDK